MNTGESSLATLTPEAPGWRLVENRHEPRRLCRGVINIFHSEGLSTRLVQGQLLDVSNCGFRAMHDEPLLISGTRIRFTHKLFHGAARVIWSRIAGGNIEAGFMVLRE